MAKDRLSLVFRALADPIRRSILTRLADGEATVAELAAPFDVSQPAISKHLKMLEDAGLVSRSRRATARLSHLEAEPLREVTAWLARYQRFWDQSHERLDELLAALQPGPGGQGVPGGRAGREGAEQAGTGQDGTGRPEGSDDE